MRFSRRFFLTIAVFLFLSACHSTRPDGASNVHEGALQGPADLVIVADIQINYNYGAPTFWGSGFSRKRIEAVSERSVQQTVLADSLLESVVKRARLADNAPVIFLGDAMNLSCGQEYSRFEAAMRNAGAEWFAAPGNHDGFYSGITSPEKEYGNTISNPLDSQYGQDLDVWAAVCRRPKTYPDAKEDAASRRRKEGTSPKSDPTTGAGYVERYLGAIDQRLPTSSKSLDAFGCARRVWNEGVLREMVTCPSSTSPERRSYESFVTQRLFVPIKSEKEKVVELILLDTSVFAQPPCLVPLHDCSDAGLKGRLGNEQRSLIQGWIENAYSQGRPVVLAGHHPTEIWDENDQKWLSGLAAGKRVASYISAHTHFGCIREPFKEQPAFREINVGSLIDQPIGYERIWLHNELDRLSIAAEYQLVSTSFFGQPKSGVCNIQFEGDLSLETQGKGQSALAYSSQLPLIAAELKLHKELLTHLEGDSVDHAAWQKRLDRQLENVHAAQRIDTNSCGQTYRLVLRNSLDCERNTVVPGLNQSIHDVAESAKAELLELTTNDAWKREIQSPDMVDSLACLASRAPGPYWSFIAKDKKRDAQCVGQ